MSAIPIRDSKIETETSINYGRIIVSGLYDDISPIGLEAVVYSQERLPEPVLATEPLSTNKVTLRRIAECELIINPLQMKSLYMWLGKKLLNMRKYSEKSHHLKT